MSALLETGSAQPNGDIPAASAAVAEPVRVTPGGGVTVSSLTVHRALSLLAVCGLFGPALKAWSEIVAVPASGLAIVALTGASLWMLCALAAAPDELALRRLDRWIVVLGLLTLAAWAGSLLYATSGYSTDEAAFLQGAANLLLHGHDPYGASLAGSLTRFAVPPAFWTYTTSGGMVSTLGYPALPVLIVAPFVELTGGGQAVPIADFCMLGLAVVAMFRVLPHPLKPLAVLAGVGLPSLMNFALGGLGEVMMLAALIVAAHRWTEIGAGGRLRRSGIVAAVALGLAVSTNQLAWFLAPFLLAGIFAARRSELGGRAAARVTAAYLGVCAATFLAVNLPFIVWSPGPWLRAVAEPLLQHALPYGQGLIGASLFGGAGGGAVELMSVGGALLYLALLGLFLADFRRLHRAVFMLPMLALFVSGRSLGGYWMMLAPVLVTSAIVALPRSPARGPVRTAARRRVALAALFVPAAACLAVALSTPAPLSIQILSAHSDPQLRAVDRLTVAVVNRSGERLVPHFATDTKGQMTAFWSIRRGPASLAAGQSADYELTMSDASSMPENATPFVLQAVTDSPRTTSTSGRFVGSGLAPSRW